MLEKLLENIHGTDAVLLAICYLMSEAMRNESIDSDVAIVGLAAMASLGIVVMLGRIILTIVRVRRLRRPQVTRAR